MFRITVPLFLFFAFPFLLLALALKSWVPLALGGFAGGAGVSFILMRAWDLWSAKLRLSPVDPVMAARIQQIFREVAEVRIEPELYSFRAAEPRAMLWVRGRQSLAVVMSIGFLQSATDETLRHGFRGLDGARLQRIRLENARQAVEDCFEVWKGRRDRFRYWWVSFWLLPIERLLTIARI